MAKSARCDHPSNWLGLDNLPPARSFTALLLAFVVFCEPSSLAKGTFVPSQIECRAGDLMFCDLDGDGLKDVILVDGLKLSIFFQNVQGGFSQEPQQQLKPEERPFVIWPARLETKAESLLLMTSDGIAELVFTNRVNPPTRGQIITQRTIIPEELEHKEAMYLNLSPKTGSGWPLLLVPTPEGLQVWSRLSNVAKAADGDQSSQWRQVQSLEQTLDARIRPVISNPGYTRSIALSISLADINGDRREDLMVKRDLAAGLQAYSLYTQQSNVLFNPQPSLMFTNKPDWRSSLWWCDVNGDGKLDLIRSTLADEPFFVPGLPSGKVVVAVHVADDHGRIPAKPQQVFRKHDWSTSLPLVDVDGDGLVDMVLGYVPINTREGFRKMVTAEEVDLSLRIYFRRRGAAYPLELDCQREVVIHFEREFFFNVEHRLYHERFINLDGDFNGDGKKDLLVRDHRNDISVYFFKSREKGFDSDADLSFSCPEPVDFWQIYDLNNDGVSDLIVKLSGRDLVRMFISQGK